jgi:hypothetical protein
LRDHHNDAAQIDARISDHHQGQLEYSDRSDLCRTGLEQMMALPQGHLSQSMQRLQAMLLSSSIHLHAKWHMIPNASLRVTFQVELRGNLPALYLELRFRRIVDEMLRT